MCAEVLACENARRNSIPRLVIPVNAFNQERHESILNWLKDANITTMQNILHQLHVFKYSLKGLVTQ